MAHGTQVDVVWQKAGSGAHVLVEVAAQWMPYGGQELQTQYATPNAHTPNNSSSYVQSKAILSKENCRLCTGKKNFVWYNW